MTGDATMIYVDEFLDPDESEFQSDWDEFDYNSHPLSESGKVFMCDMRKFVFLA